MKQFITSLMALSLIVAFVPACNKQDKQKDQSLEQQTQNPEQNNAEEMPSSEGKQNSENENKGEAPQENSDKAVDQIENKSGDASETMKKSEKITLLGEDGEEIGQIQISVRTSHIIQPEMVS